MGEFSITVLFPCTGRTMTYCLGLTATSQTFWDRLKCPDCRERHRQLVEVRRTHTQELLWSIDGSESIPASELLF